MNGSYYIGGKRRKKRRLASPKKTCLFLLVFLLSALVWVQLALLPQVRALCEVTISNRLEALATVKACTVLQEGNYAYSDFIHLNYDTNGSLRSASVDTVKLNVLKNTLALDVLRELVAQDVTVSVPAGNLFRLLFFSGHGKNIDVTAHVAEGMHARFHTVFTSAGINQTRHAIGFSLDFNATYLLATGAERLTFSVNIPLGETLIVGDVPDTLTQINRLAEDISEIEIDDAVDFGHVIP